MQPDQAIGNADSARMPSAGQLLPGGVVRIAVTGGRDFDSWHLVVHTLRQMPEGAILVHGAAPGADSLCAEWWDMQGRVCEPHPADWTAPCRPTCKEGHRRTRPDGSDYCPAEGHYRNQRMVDSGIDLLIAFPGGRGTADMVSRCQRAGVRVLDPLRGEMPSLNGGSGVNGG